jgi:hypothetical protein
LDETIAISAIEKTPLAMSSRNTTEASKRILVISVEQGQANQEMSRRFIGFPPGRLAVPQGK